MGAGIFTEGYLIANPVTRQTEMFQPIYGAFVAASQKEYYREHH